MKRTALLALVAAVSLAMTATLVACAAPTPGIATIQTITPQEAKSRLDSDKSIVLIDVRTPSEFFEGHIAGALLISVDILEAKAASAIPDKNGTYFVYCRSGNRSATASRLLVRLGYQHVYDLGGIIDWPYGTVS